MAKHKRRRLLDNLKSMQFGNFLTWCNILAANSCFSISLINLNKRIRRKGDLMYTEIHRPLYKTSICNINKWEILVKASITYIKLHVDRSHTMYAAAVYSGNSPFEPRWAMLYGLDVCRGCLSTSSNLLGSGLPTHPTIVSRIRKDTTTKHVKCTTSMFTLILVKVNLINN